MLQLARKKKENITMLYKFVCVHYEAMEGVCVSIYICSCVGVCVVLYLFMCVRAHVNRCVNINKQQVFYSEGRSRRPSSSDESKRRKPTSHQNHLHSQKVSIRIRHHIEVVSWPRKISNHSSKKTKEYFRFNYIYTIYLYFVLLYQPNIWYIMCFYGYGPWQHHEKSTMIKQRH